MKRADELKSEHFLDRREMGIINIGGDAVIKAGEQSFINSDSKKLCILGKGQEDVVFRSVDPEKSGKTVY